MRTHTLLAMLVLVGCTSANEGSPASPAPLPASPSPAAAASGQRSIFVRTCESKVVGALGPDWRRGQIEAGPVVFVGAAGYADVPRSRFAAPGELARSQKVLVVVLGPGPVEVSVPDPDAALAYDPARWGERNVVPFRRGDARVRFEPCGDRRWTQFNGAFLLRGPRCVPVEVRPADDSPIIATISFGAGDRC